MKKSQKSFSLFSLVLCFVFLLSNLTYANNIKGGANNLLAVENFQIIHITENTANLSWNSVKNASGYTIFLAPSNGGFSQIATVYNTAFTLTNLNPQTSYSVYIRAFSSRASSDSKTLQFTTQSLYVSPTPIEEPIPIPAPKKSVMGFATYYATGDKSSLNAMPLYNGSLDEVITHTFIMDSLGNLSGLVPLEQIAYAKQNNIKLTAMFSNNFSGSIAKSVLESTENKNRLIQNIEKELITYGYTGLNIDIEGTYYTNRNEYTSFMKELYETLSPKGFSVSISVPAKTTDNPLNTWNGAYDYKALSAYADQIVLMAYDEHYPGGTSGPVASYPWVKSVLAYSSTVIPKEKIILGVAAYGYDWSSIGTKAYGINGIYNLASTYGASIQWDSVSRTSYFHYVDNNNISHTVWFENDLSLSHKLDLVNEFDTAGIAIWRLGLENNLYREMIQNKLNK